MDDKHEQMTADTNAAGVARPPKITAREFVEQGFREKLERKECTISLDFETGGWVENVIPSTRHDLFYVHKYDGLGEYGVTFLYGDESLIVSWLQPQAPVTPQPAPPAVAAPSVAGDADPARRYEGYTYGDLLARVIDQDRIIHELYTGKHGVIPHPADVYQAGLWEIYKPDQYQAHAERVGDVGELTALRDHVDGLRVALGEARDYLDNVSPQALNHNKSAMHSLESAYNVIDKALANLDSGAAAQANATTEGG